MNYLFIKYLHVTCVLLSGLGFCLRGWWMWRGSKCLQHRAVKVVPHYVDSLLLGSALMMAFLSGQYPFLQPWLTGKFFGLVAYIGLGSMAIKRAKTRELRMMYFSLALLAYIYIVSVALTRSPFPFF